MLGNPEPVLVGLLLSFTLWAVLVILALVDGLGGVLLSLEYVAIHVRLLAVIPLLFACDAVFHPSIRRFCGSLITGEILAGDDLAAMDAEARRLDRLNESWLPEAVILALVAIFGATVAQSLLPGVSVSLHRIGVAQGGSLAAAWYAIVCLPVLRFLLLRWAWKFGLWIYLLWRISRRRLDLIASHPDLAGGLGVLEATQQQLAPFVLAVSVVDSAGLAEVFQAGGFDPTAIYFQALVVLIVAVTIVCGPLLFFVRPLYQCRQTAQVAFSDLSQRYVRRFEDRWLRARPPRDDDLLGSADIQSLADLSNSYANVRSIRLVIASWRLAQSIVVSTFAPFLPLLLFRYPATDAVAAIFRMLVGA